MSVTQVRNFIEKSGCGLIVAVVIGLVMLLGVFTGQCSRGARADEAARRNSEEAASKSIVGKVGDTPITAEEVEKAYQEAMSQMQLPEPQGALFEAQSFAYALGNVVNDSLINGVAKKYGVAVTEDDLKKEAGVQAEAQLGQMKNQLIQQKTVKAEATAAEMDEAFKKQYGVTTEEAKNRMVENVLADARMRKQIDQMVVFSKAREAAKATVQISDADLKVAQGVATVKRIYVPAGDTAKATIEKAAAEIKAGASFEATMKKYTKDAPMAGKPITEREEPFLMGQAFSDPKLAVMKQAKLGFVSPPIETGGGWVIYKVVKAPVVAQDFDKQKEMYRAQYVDMAASNKIAEEIKAMRESTKPTWSDPGFAALYAASETTTKQGDERTKALEAILKMEDGGEFGKRAGAFAKYLAMENLWPTLKPEQQKARATERLEIITRLLEFTDGPDIQLTIARTLADNKDMGAGDALLKAAQQNTSYGLRGQQIFGDVSGLLSRLKSQKLIKDEVATEVTKAQAEWQKTKADYEAEQKKQAAEEEKQRKEFEAEKKKSEEEERKRQAQEKAKAKPEAGKKDAGVSSDALAPKDGPATGGLPGNP